jgi:hypothetical protein
MTLTAKVPLPSIERFPFCYRPGGANRVVAAPCQIAITRCGGCDDSLKCRVDTVRLPSPQADKVMRVRLGMPGGFLAQCGENRIGEFKQGRVIVGGQGHIVHRRQGVFNALPE